MAVALALLIQRTEAALAAATDPKKKLRLERDLSSFKLTALRAESPDDDDDGGDDGGDDKAAKHAKKAELNKKKSEAFKHKAKADEHRQKAAEADEEARKCMGDEDDGEDEEAKALRAELVVRTSALPDGAAAALASQAGQDAVLRARLDTLEKERAAERKGASIEAALAGRRITPGEAKTLGAKSDEFVRDFLAMRPKAIVNTDETDMQHPNPQENADLAPAALAEIDKMVASLAGLNDEQRVVVKKNMIDGRRKLQAGASNGSPGRY